MLLSDVKRLEIDVILLLQDVKTLQNDVVEFKLKSRLSLECNIIPVNVKNKYWIKLKVKVSLSYDVGIVLIFLS